MAYDQDTPDYLKVFTQADFDVVCQRIAQGETLAAICKALDWSSTAVYGFKRGDPQREAQYEEARDIGFDAMAEHSIEIIDGLAPVAGVPVEAARDKARAEHRLKLLARWSPRKYGERMQIADADGGRLALAPMVADVMGMLRGAVARPVEVTRVETLPAVQAAPEEPQDCSDLV